MDGGKSGIFSFLMLIFILVFSLMTVLQKGRTELRLKKINEELTTIKDDLKKNTREVSSAASDVKGVKENFKETRVNFRDLQGESRVFRTRMEDLSGRMQALSESVRRLGEEVRRLEVRAAAAAGGAEGPRRARGEKEPGGADGAEKEPGGAEKEPGGADGAEKEPGGADGAEKEPGGADEPGGDRPPIPEESDVVVRAAEHRDWGSEGPTDEELDALWQPDGEGVIRPVIDDYTAGDYDPSRDGGVLVATLSSDPKGFNPLTESSNDVSYLSSYCLAGLCTRLPDRPAVWVYDLAEAAEISDDYKVYTIRIRKGVHWQAPLVDYADPKYEWLRDADREVTARDFQFAFELIMNKQVQCAHTRVYYMDIASFEVLDRYTLRITWKKKMYNSIWVSLGMAPVAEFLYAFDENGTRFPDSSLGLEFNEHWYNNKILSCGQFHFAEWKKGEYILLKKNPDYYGRLANLDGIRYMIVRDDEQVLLKLKNHEIQFGGLARPQYKKEVLEKGDRGMFYRRGEQKVKEQTILYDTYLRFGYYYIGWNLNNVKFKDRRVREALTYACPRRKILKDLFHNLGEVVTGPIYRYHSYYNEDLPERPFDLVKAKTLLAEAGWGDSDGNGILDKVIDGKRVQFEFKLLIYANSPVYKELAELFKESLRKIGVLLTASPLDWALMQKKMESREFEAYTGGWALGWEVDPYQLWHSSQADTDKSSNMVAFRNQEVDDIIMKGRVTFDEAKRRNLFRRFHEIIYLEQPYTFLFCVKSIPAWWPEVRNVSFSLIRPQPRKGRWYLLPD